MSRPLCTCVLLAGLLAGCNGEQPVNARPSPPAPVVIDGSLMEPGRPQLESLPATVAPGRRAVGWHMWWGENGRRWSLLVNGKPVASGALQAQSPQEQQGKADLSLDQPGRYELQVSLCNDHGCSKSEPAVVEVVAGNS